MSLFRSHHASCMLYKSSQHVLDYSKNEFLAGEKFNVDEQCKLVFGPNSTVCTYMVCNNNNIIQYFVILKLLCVLALKK